MSGGFFYFKKQKGCKNIKKKEYRRVKNIFILKKIKNYVIIKFKSDLLTVQAKILGKRYNRLCGISIMLNSYYPYKNVYDI